MKRLAIPEASKLVEIGEKVTHPPFLALCVFEDGTATLLGAASAREVWEGFSSSEDDRPLRSLGFYHSVSAGRLLDMQREEAAPDRVKWWWRWRRSAKITGRSLQEVNHGTVGN